MQTIHLTVPTTVPAANAMQLILAWRRGFLGPPRQTRPKAKAIQLDGRTLRIVFQEPLQAGQPVSMALAAEGEGIRVASIEQRRVYAKELACAEDDLGVLFSQHETSPADIFAWRAAREVGMFAREKRFFNQLDEKTWDQKDPDQLAVLGLLEHVFEKRRAGNMSSVIALEKTADPVQCLKFTKKFHESARTAFGDPFTVAQIEDAFDRFARGELSLLDVADLPSDPTFEEFKARACQPDSTFYLYFAEFVSVCLRKGVEPLFWDALLPSLVQTQASFFEAYAGPNGDPIPYGLLLGGRWPPAVFESPDALHQARQAFKTNWVPYLDAVRTNYANQFVEL